MYIIKENEVLAAFDVDAQKCFTPLCPNELPVPEGNTIVDELNKQAALARYRIGSKDAHAPNAVWVASAQHPQLSPVLGHANADLYWNAHAVVGTVGFEQIDGLPAATDYDFFVWKGIEIDMHPYGACYHDLTEQLSTGVIEFLQHRGVTTILVGGLALDHCVKTTALQLRQAGFTVIVNLAACRGLAVASVDGALDQMHTAGIVIVRCSDELQFLSDAE